MARYKVHYLQPRETEIEAESLYEASEKFKEAYGEKCTITQCYPKHSHKEYEEPLDNGA